MKRFLIVLVSFTLILGLLVACSPQEESEVEEPSVPEEEQEEKADEEKEYIVGEGGTDGLMPPGEMTKPLPIPESAELLHPLIRNVEINGRDNNFNSLAKVRYGKVELNKEERELYPELVTILEEVNREIEYGKDEDFFELYGDAKEFFSHEENRGYENYLDDIKVDIMRADSTVFSIHYYDRYNAGGPHGGIHHSGVNIDTQTGERLQVDDVFNDVDKLLEILKDKLLNGPKKEHIDPEELDAKLKNYRVNLEEINWIIDQNGVVFFFNEYEIAAYASGMFIVYLPFEEYPDLINKRYTVATDSYVKPIIPSRVNHLYWDDEEVIELVYYYYGDDYEVEHLYFETDNSEAVFDMYCFEANTFQVHHNGKSYIYAFCEGEGGGAFVKVLDIQNGEIVEIAQLDSISLNLVDMDYDFLDEDRNVNGGEMVYTVFTDPENGIFSSMIYALSSLRGVKDYYVNEDGLLVSDLDYYILSDDWKNDWLDEFNPTELVLTAKVELDMNLLDEDLNLGEEIIILPGTELTYIRTDDETWSDFRLEDGREVRARIGVYTVPDTICDIDVFDALDGLFIAG